MVKKQKNFFDDYDSIFLEPREKAIKEKSVGQKKSSEAFYKESQKQKSSKIDVILRILVVAVVIFLLYFIGSSDNTEITEPKELASSEEYRQPPVRENVEIYPLKINSIRQASEVDKTKPIHALLDEETKNIIVNGEYQFDILGRTEIHSETIKEWSVVPDLNDFPIDEYMLNVQVYKEDDTSEAISFYMYANVINGIHVNLEQNSGSKVKVFERPDIDNIQNGYFLIHKVDVDGLSKDNIFRYYIFPDGTGIVVNKMASQEAEISSNNITSMTFELFEKAFQKDLDLMNETVPFSKL